MGTGVLLVVLAIGAGSRVSAERLSSADSGSVL